MRIFGLEFVLFFVLTALTLPAFAGVHRMDQDIKLPSQQVIEMQTISAPALGTSTAVHAAVNNPSTSAALVVTTGITNPDVPRNITVTTGGTTGDCAAGNVVITGTDIFSKALTENLAITNAQNGTTTGAKAFKTVTSISLPAEQSTHSCTFAIGRGSKLGLKRCMDQAGAFFHAALAGVKETTAPTVAASASSISGNTASLNSALNGSDVTLFFVQNFRCFP